MTCLKNIDAVILCGGLGTRIVPAIGTDIPKCLAPVKGKPFLDHLIACLQTFGARRFILVAGHLWDKVVDWAEKAGDLSIDIVIEAEPRSQANAACAGAKLVQSEDMLIVNGDTYVKADICKFVDLYRRYPLDLAKLRLRRHASSWLWKHPSHKGRLALHKPAFADAGLYLMKTSMANRYISTDFELSMNYQCLGLKEIDLEEGEFLDIGKPKWYALAEGFIP